MALSIQINRHAKPFVERCNLKYSLLMKARKIFFLINLKQITKTKIFFIKLLLLFSCFKTKTVMQFPIQYPPSFRCRRLRLKGIHSRSDTNRTGANSLSFYYPRLLHCLDQMLAVMSLSQHRVSSSKTVRPRAPCGARCIGHAVSTWSAVCSEAPHSQFGEGARPHLCMDEWNRPTPVRRRLSLTMDS